MSNILDILAFQKKLRNKHLTVCPYCNKPFDQSSWTTKTFVCNLDTGEHEPVKFIHNGRVLRPL